MPETNVQADLVNKAVAGAVAVAEKTAAAAASAALDTNLPFFALPVIHQISDAILAEIISLIGGQLSIGLQQIGTFLVIDTQITKEQNGVSQSLATLMLAEKKGDQDEIQKAIRAYAAAQAALIHNDGSSQPI